MHIGQFISGLENHTKDKKYFSERQEQSKEFYLKIAF